MTRSCPAAAAAVFLVSVLSSCAPGGKGGAAPVQPFQHMKYIHYVNASGEKGVTTFDYDPGGRSTLAVWELLDGSRSSLDRLTYDDDGFLTARYRRYSDGINSKETFEHGVDGRLLRETFSRSDGVEGGAEYEYDGSGSISRARCHRHRGWFDGELVFTCEDGRKISATILSDGAHAGEISYSYDDKGRLSGEHWQFDGGWSQTFTYEYPREGAPAHGPYRSSNVFIRPHEGWAVSGEDYDFSGRQGGPSYYGYEPDGKLVEKRFVRSDGLTTTTAFIYDRGRRLARSYRIYADGRCGVFSYDYDDDGDLTSRVLKVNDGTGSSESYIYDDGGRLVEARYDHFDSWLTGAIIFEHDGDLLSRGTFSAAEGPGADIAFEHDGKGRLTRVHWKFESGHTQTYWFRYASLDKLHPIFPAAEAISAIPGPSKSADEPAPLLFVTSAGDTAQMERAYRLALSIRAFAGEFSSAPVWVFGPEAVTTGDSSAVRRFAALGAELKSLGPGDDSCPFYLSRMVHAPAEAERQAEGRVRVMVYLGSDSAVLQEPSAFMLPEGVALGYCPVMHRNICPLYGQPLDGFWIRAFEIMEVDDSDLFGMVTPADGDTILPYFNAGCLAVRPERGLMRKREEIFERFCADEQLKSLAMKDDERRRVFAFQVALTGAVLNSLERGEMVELPRESYNYPIFFNEMFGAKNDFHDIDGVALIRYEFFFDRPLEGWEKMLHGPADRIDWLRRYYTLY